MSAKAKSTMKRASFSATKKSSTFAFLTREQMIAKLEKIDRETQKSNLSVTILAGIDRMRLDKKTIRQIISALRGDLSTKLAEQEQDEYLSTTEIAALLNVSRPFVAKLIDTKKLRGRLKGDSHRQAKRSDVLKYKAEMEQQQSEALDRMAADGQEDGMPL